MKSLQVTLTYAFFAVPLTLTAALAAALLLNQKLPGIHFFRTTFYLPTIVPGLATAFVWGWLLNPNVGLVNSVLQQLGLPKGEWFTGTETALPTLIVLALWGIGPTMVVFLAGPNPALPPEAPYSEAHYQHVCERYGDPAQLAKYDCYFVDSITVLARLALIWSKAQPQAMSERTGKPDTRGAYGLLGTEMLGSLMHLQHARGKHVVFVAILDERMDDFNRKVFVPQIEGAKTSAELPGIVDEVVTLAEIKAEDGSSYRAFITQTMNPYGYPAKDRSGQLDLLEPPDLRALIEKCAAATQPKNSKE